MKYTLGFFIGIFAEIFWYIVFTFGTIEMTMFLIYRLYIKNNSEDYTYKKYRHMIYNMGSGIYKLRNLLLIISSVFFVRIFMQITDIPVFRILNELMDFKLDGSSFIYGLSNLIIFLFVALIGVIFMVILQWPLFIYVPVAFFIIILFYITVSTAIDDANDKKIEKQNISQNKPNIEIINSAVKK